MLNELFWAMASYALTAFITDARRSMQAGPVDDAADAGLPVQRYGGLAVIPVSGAMMKRGLSFFGMRISTSTRDVQQALAAAVADERVDQIMLLIDSPGGSVDGTVELADAVYAARQSKPIIAQVDGMAASAAYWVASQANTIVASRSALVGSIGVFTILYDDSRAFENAGIEAIPITTGEFKVIGAPGVEITEAQAADYQRTVDQYFGDFLDAIRRGRPQMSDDEILNAADGRVFKADSEALGMKLIDAVGWPSETIATYTSRQSRRRRARAANARQAIYQFNAQERGR